MFNIIDYWKTAREDCLNKMAMRDLFAEVGILIGGLMILIFIIVSIFIMPFMLIITPFSLLNRASKKWFQEKPQGIIEKVYGEPGKGRMYRIYDYHCPNCGNTWHTNYNADVCNICGYQKIIKISEHEYEMEE